MKIFYLLTMILSISASSVFAAQLIPVVAVNHPPYPISMAPTHADYLDHVQCQMNDLNPNYIRVGSTLLNWLEMIKNEPITQNSIDALDTIQGFKNTLTNHIPNDDIYDKLRMRIEDVTQLIALHQR